jgi:hypothetical protein
MDRDRMERDSMALLRRSKWNGMVYHAAPLHYLPNILAAGALLSARDSAAYGIAPRSTAIRRDRMLDVDRYVHFAFELLTPLLLDKLSKQLPHIVLCFDAIGLSADRPCALQRFNTKAWRSRAAFSTMTEPCDVAWLLRRNFDYGRCKSMEMLAEGDAPLAHLVQITAFSQSDARISQRLCSVLAPHLGVPVTWARGSIAYGDHDYRELRDYIENCINAGSVLRPPRLRFD